MDSDFPTTTPLSWEQLTGLAPQESDRTNGENNSYALLRLFGHSEETVRVILYRDNHAWCPYCQKVWLWLEWKRIPYKVKKITMRCYGNKESWYLNKVPSGMLPAIEIDNQLLTESDEILLALENIFGSLGTPLRAPKALKLRNLERKLFRAWCLWLCQPSLIQSQDNWRREQFQRLAQEMEYSFLDELPWLDAAIDKSGCSLPGSSDVIFIPYLERMNASLAYYKGFNLREQHPLINRWFTALEALEAYRGTQGDFHTHAHDLPPQMGGCFFDKNQLQKQFSTAIDSGEGLGCMETCFSQEKQSENKGPEFIALTRVLKHRQTLLDLNPLGAELFDQPLRAALTFLMKGKLCSPHKGTASGLRYLRDRISVPRDMPLLAARKLRQAIEKTAQLDNPEQGALISTKNRFDQNPEPFSKKHQKQ